jgi:hypothetical protein
MFVEFPWLSQDKERLISKYLAQEKSRYIFHSYIISGASVGMILPNIWKNKINVPNHQPICNMV